MHEAALRWLKQEYFCYTGAENTASAAATKADDEANKNETEPEGRREQSGEFNEFDESILTPRNVNVSSEQETPKESTPKPKKKKGAKKFSNKKKDKETFNDSGIEESPRTNADDLFGASTSGAKRSQLLELPPVRKTATLQSKNDDLDDDDFGDLLDSSA
jgi:hypothetical protein